MAGAYPLAGRAHQGREPASARHAGREPRGSGHRRPRRAGQQLIKFHGSYQQDDRDIREERRLRNSSPPTASWSARGCRRASCTPAQWLALDGLAGSYGNGTLRLTTRQAFQFHGILKRDLKAHIAAMNAALVDSIAACGDVNRNVMASANPLESRVHAEAHR